MEPPVFTRLKVVSTMPMVMVWQDQVMLLHQHLLMMIIPVFFNMYVLNMQDMLFNPIKRSTV